MTKPVFLVCLLICLIAMGLVRENFGFNKQRCGSATYRRKFGVCGKRGIRKNPAAEFKEELTTRCGLRVLPIIALIFYFIRIYFRRMLRLKIPKF